MEQLSNLVSCLKGQIDEFHCHGYLPFADLVIYGLYFMGKSGNGVKTKHGARTLNGVHGTEDPSYEVHILRGVSKLKEGVFKFYK